MKKVSVFLSSIFVFCICFGRLSGHEIVLDTQDGETYILDVDPDISLSSLQETIKTLMDGQSGDFLIVSNEIKVGFVSLQAANSHGQFLGTRRIYENPLLEQEKADIRYIVTTLANNKNLISLAFEKGDLEAAGDRIDHVHPLRFLMAVFTDEELKVGIRNIHRKVKVWNSFAAGLKKSLATESSLDNMTDAYIYDFAYNVGIDYRMIYPSAQRGEWDEFIDLLIIHVPRTGDFDRYGF